MEEVPNIRARMKLENDQQYWREYPITYSASPESVIKEEPKSDEEDGGECTLVAYLPLPHGVIKDEPSRSGAVYDEDGDFQAFFNATPVADGFLQIVPGSVISLAKSAPVTVDVGETQIKLDNADAGLPLTHQPNYGYREYAVTYSPLSKVVKEERQSCEQLEDNFASIPTLNHTVGESSKADHESGTKQGTERSRTGKRKRTTSSGERKTTAELMKNRGNTKEKQCAQNDDKNDHSSLEDNDSSVENDIRSRERHEASQQKQNATGKAVPKANYPYETDRLYECENCGRSYKYKQNLTRHLNGECGVEPHIPCLVCGNQFKTQHILRGHLTKIHKVDRSQLEAFGIKRKIRSGMLPFKCGKCGKSYKRKNHLEEHLIYDCGLDPTFQCIQCEYRAKRKNNLRAHLINIHKVDRSQLVNFRAGNAPVPRPIQPFKCEKCDRSYKTKGNLNQHLKYECGLDPSFACTHCDFKTIRKSALTKHLRDVHGEGPYQLK